MRAIAAYIMRGPVQAVLVTAVLALISLIPVLGMVSVLSGAAVALVTLRHGAKQGLLVLLGASAVAGVFMYLIFGTVLLGLVFSLLLWLPLWGLALLLRSSSSWSMLLDATVALGILAIAAFYLALPDPIQFWQLLLAQMLEAMSAQQGMSELEMLQEQLPAIAEWMTGMLVAALLMGLVASMMLARWWQALLYNPGGFRQEFYDLRLSRMAALTVFIIFGISIMNLGQISFMAGDVMVTVVVVYSLAGLALVHALVGRLGKHVGWLVALYVLMFIAPPHVLVVLASTAFADSWIDFRARLPLKDGGKREDNQ